MKKQSIIDPMIFEPLSQFRQSLHQSLGKAKDAMFDLMDAVLVSASISSFVSLSQSPVFRRRWSSIDAALQDSRRPDSKVNRGLAERVDTEPQPLLAGDQTLWPRQDAPTLRERTFARDSRQTRAVGHSYSTLAWLPADGGS